MREGDLGQGDSTVVAKDSNDDAGYLAMLFSDLGDFPPVERPAEEAPQHEQLTEEMPPAADAAAETAGVVAVVAETSESQPAFKAAVGVKPQPVRPFIDEVLNVQSVPSAQSSRVGRWRVAALSVVGFLAVGGTAVAVLSLGYQQNARARQVLRASALIPAQAPEQSGSAAVVGEAAPVTGFQGCTKGEGLSPMGLLLVAKDFVPTIGPPPVCLPPTEKAPKRPASDAAKADQPSPTENPTVTVVGPAPADSTAGSGTSTVPPAGSGGDPGTGGDTGTGGGDTGSGTDGGEVVPPDDGTTDEGKTHGKGWGKGGSKGGKPGEKT